MKARNRLSLTLIVALSALGLIATLLAGWKPGLGLDLQGGASVLMKPIGEVRPGALEKARSIIEQRVNGQGIGEADVRVEGSRILIEVPGVKDPQQLLDLVGQTAELRFRPVIQELPAEFDPLAPAPTSVAPKAVSKTSTSVAGSTKVAPKAASPTTAAPTTIADLGDPGFAVVAQSADSTVKPSPTTKLAATTTPGATTKPGKPGSTVVTKPAPAAEDPLKSIDKETGFTSREADLATATVFLGGIDGKKYLLGPSEGNGEIVKEAIAEINQSRGSWQVRLNMTDKGAGEFDRIAEATVNKQLAIVLDGVVQSAPVIQTTRFNGTAEISGTFTEKEAKDLASVLRYGSLPVQLEQQQVQTVSASLGRDSLRAGLLTGFLGLALVAAYMLFYYRSLGLVVIAGLLTSFGLLWTLLGLLTKTNGLALSLAGAVGIIVSVGVTVDSYVVYFERLRDEIRHGRSVDASIERGFKKAWHTILAADGVSILGAFVLYVLTVGSVRGFALMLMISTALDIVVAWFFTRPLVSLLAHNKFFTTGKWGVTSSGSFGGMTGGASAAPATASVGSRDGIIRPGSATRSTGELK
jgi:preprotein translocase subunit SecD